MYRRVADAHVIALFEECYAKAVRLAQARGHLAEAEAEDVVQDVFLAIWKTRHYFVEPPPPAYVYRAAIHSARRLHRYAWRRYVVPMAPDVLGLAEQAMYRPSPGAHWLTEREAEAERWRAEQAEDALAAQLAVDPAHREAAVRAGLVPK
jgi:DNA-directed RNA polymerase specialized sigma24 family protein